MSNSLWEKQNRQLRKCIDDVSSMLADRSYELERMGGDECNEEKTINQVFKRINRTLNSIDKQKQQTKTNQRNETNHTAGGNAASSAKD